MDKSLATAGGARGSGEADDLNTPLGVGSTRAPASSGRIIGALALAILAVPALALAGWLAFVRDPLGGEPLAVVAIERPAVVASLAPADAPRPPPDRQRGREVEEESGVRVIRPGQAGAPGVLVLRVPDSGQEVRLAPAPDRRLIERGRHGPLPKVGADGSRPLEVYARPTPPARLAAPARLVVVVTGLGIAAQASQDAITKLPPEVTLAFAPYGRDVDRIAARAREQGHEILLQAPMEPFDYPDSDPGPQTLLTSFSPEQNRDRLHWLMSRFPGYVGIASYMGGRLLSDEAALAPIMREIGQRGLGFFDDGGGGRNISLRLAAQENVRALRADLIIDAIPRGPDIDRALERAEALARSKGLAVVSGAALPVTVERLARFLRGAEARGLVVIPFSAAALQARRP